MLLATTRGDIAEYLGTLFTIYWILILARILMSWIPRMPYNPVLSSVVRFIEDVTEPYLGLFRRFIPMARVGGAGIDLSPIVALLVLQLVRGIVVGLVAGDAA